MTPFKAELLPSTQEVIERMLDAYKKANPWRYSKPERYRRLIKEFYDWEIKRRVRRTQKLKDGNIWVPEKIKAVKMLISQREHIINFMVDWCWTYDPRLLTDGLPTTLPWIPWPAQIEFIEWTYDRLFDPVMSGGLVEKSRDQGATWLFCLRFLHEWRWVSGYAAGIGSNKYEGVDKKDDPKCIFEKIRGILRGLPAWWFPKGWDPGKHDNVAKLINPENGASIVGEGGKEIGRGGRTTEYLVDEKASLEFPNMADAALSQNTRCQFDLSTPKGPNSFYEKRSSGRVAVHTLHWEDDPRKDDLWYQHESGRMDPAEVAQEIDINYHASVEDIFIRPEWVEAAFKIQLQPGGPIDSALDVAAGGTNKSAVATFLKPVMLVSEFNISNGVDLSYTFLDISKKADVAWASYDVIGVGHAVKSTLERTEREVDFPIYPLVAQKRASDMYYEEFKCKGFEIFTDSRTEWWYIFAKRLEQTWEHQTGKRKYENHELISLEKVKDLKNQICSPKKFHTPEGKIRCESKKLMIARGIKSPDMADACVMAIMPRDAGHKHVVGMDIKKADVKVGWGQLPKHRCVHYGAICQDKDLSIYFMSAIWHEVYGHLFIYDEFKLDRPDNSIANRIVKKMHLLEFELDRLIGNEFMFADEKRSVAKEINNKLWDLTHRVQTIKIKHPRKYDPYGSMSILNELVNKNKFTVDNKCKEVHKQLSAWRLDHEKATAEGMRECILMIMSELVKVVPIEVILSRVEYRPVHAPPPKPDDKGKGFMLI